MSDSEERTTPLLNRPPDLPPRAENYSVLSHRPKDTEYRTLERGPLDRQSDVPLLCDDSNDIAVADIITEKDGKCDTENHSDGTIVIAEDFQDGCSDDADCSSIVSTPYLIPIKKMSSDSDIPQSPSLSVQSSGSKDKEIEVSTSPGGYLQFTEVPKKKEEVPSSTHQDNSEPEDDPHHYFILEKEEDISPDEGSDVLASASMHPDHAESQPQTNANGVSTNKMTFDQRDGDSPGSNSQCVTEDSGLERADKIDPVKSEKQ